jgi:peptidoglycan/xylan/chitin deacetylase (PgdA/CDA1 family)
MLRVERFMRTLMRISRTRYPAFILGSQLPREEIPVFIYHDVEADAFASDLNFLRRNGYRTLCLDEYLAARAGEVRPGRAVLLTFDDARKSFGAVALPLLRQFDARAVLFAPTYWMQPARNVADDLFMSWDQLRACAESGLIDVQSHAHRHALVAVSSEVIDFANPQALARFDIYDWPMRCLDGGDELGRPALGTPVYRAAPLLSAGRRYLESGAATHACRAFVEQHGGGQFFVQPDWRARLTRVFRQREREAPGRLMDAAAFEHLVASEFELCREEFRRHLGYAPHVIAYPWMLGSARSLQAAQRHGFRAAFGVAMDYGAERRRDRLPLPVYGRLKSDWVQFLPGEQRASVLGALRRKVARFGAVEHLAH